MKQQIVENKFIEHVEFAGNLYGTSRIEMKDANTIPILDFDEQGVKKIKALGGYDPVYVFIEPPSIKVLERRLIGRGSEDEKSLKRRMESAESSLKYARGARGPYDVRIVNDDLTVAYDELEQFLRGEFDF